MYPNSILSQLKARVGTLPQNYGVYYKNTLVALCHAMEDHILETGNHPLVVASFQKGKWYLQEANRYALIAKTAHAVAILATADSGFLEHTTAQLPNVHLVALDADDPITEEWNLVILARDYQAMVICQELRAEDYGPAGIPTEDAERKFYGLWTFDQHLVTEALNIHLERVEHYQPEIAAHLYGIQAQIAAEPLTNQTDMSVVVSRIVQYLQTSQMELVTLNRQRQAFDELESQELKLNRNLTANKLQAFLRMAQKVDEQDPFNGNASWQVAALCETLGQLLDLSSLSVRRLRLAGLLFRVGLAQVPPELFHKSEQERTSSEQSVWVSHPQVAAKLLRTMPELTAITKIVAHQKEWWDGSGRPDGLRGEEIPLEARILGICATFQRLIMPRGIRPASNLTQALERIQAQSETRWDPSLVDVLAHLIRLAQMGLLQLPTRPQGLPSSWLGEEP